MKRFIVLLSSWFYTGYIPLAPGTFGSLAGVPLCYLVSRLHPFFGLVFVGGFVSLSIWVADRAETLFQEKDSSTIVIDEVAGITVSLFLIPFNLVQLVLGFLLFRGFDILKPFPIRLIDSRVPAGLGIVLDDVIAGLYANIALRAILLSS